jgi:cardiolipin synthase
MEEPAVDCRTEGFSTPFAFRLSPGRDDRAFTPPQLVRHNFIANRSIPGENRKERHPRGAAPTTRRRLRSPQLKLSQILSFPNQLTLLRMMFLPFIVIRLVEGHYNLALILFVIAGLSDGLDGLLARTLKQQTVLGQYLDPIADKLLLSSVFLTLSILHKIPWKFTVLVFSRDISILLASAVLYMIAGLRDFSPSIFGKANTFAQVAAVFFVLLFEINHARWTAILKLTFLRATFSFTIISAVHYVYLVGKRLHSLGHTASSA